MVTAKKAPDYLYNVTYRVVGNKTINTMPLFLRNMEIPIKKLESVLSDYVDNIIVIISIIKVNEIIEVI
jgi:hypothetical protein